MAVLSTPYNAALCGSISDLTNPDYDGQGILGAFAAGAGLVLAHQIALTIPASIKLPRRVFGKRSLDVRKSVLASSLSLFDTASVLSISWGVAAIVQLVSHNSIQTTHDALMLCLTSYASNSIALGALCTTSEHIRRHRYRFIVLSVSLALCAITGALAGPKIEKGKFPMEVCLPFFTEYLPHMRKYFKVLTGVFWGCVSVLLALLALAFFSTTPRGESSQQGTPTFRRLVQLRKMLGIWVFMLFEFGLVTMIVLVNHHFVPEQVLREQAGGQLAEGKWTFGQIISMLIWLPVVAELFFILLFGTKRGQDDSLPVSVVARLAWNQNDKESGLAAMELTVGITHACGCFHHDCSNDTV